ncbi:dual specificity testis-specific protein kinase 1-like [Mizuhopecten yessoensis]|uniref:dual-specificity kinase n=1 Tax=Mizuhopecten yessoensis TaxID=6573 RepID=A0A210Q490_MIZYE|nr:dual specificity testis-specific protein kinase 1-like [Mizuhopecten yessoensis]OWF43556.1 Dual specificity testis-specific protein kinase 2 [Mizuhopecten yessoensis]
MTLDGNMTTIRPLRRSKTIAVSDFQSARRFEDQENKENISSDEMKTRTPGSSCQALRHAVSSLNRLDDFNLERIGCGFFAEVFKVKHKTTGQVMVLKMNINKCNRMSMLREVQLMNRLSHPNILRFLGVCVHEGQLHALTEFMERGGLNEVLADKTLELPWTMKIKIALDISNGMKYLHSRGVFHRDLTSRNVLVCGDEGNLNAVVADFGLAAKIPDPLDKDNCLPIVGSPYWIAPEVLQNKWYDEKADLFSYGIILCEVIARIDAEPEILPRTQNFGLDYVAFSELLDYCPLDFLRLAFTCCHMDPLRRPVFAEIVISNEQLLRNLEEDCMIGNGNGGFKRPGHKRSMSEDNILQLSGEEVIDPGDFLTSLTPQVVLGEAMSKDDQFYSPALSNPFVGFQQFLERKILGTPSGKQSFGFELPSPSNAFTPPCSPCTPDPYSGRHRNKSGPQSQSLPSSPVLLRKAAERLHQESIHGSASRRHSMAPSKFTFNQRSKSTVFPEVLAYRLQTELAGSLEKGLASQSEICDNDVDNDYRGTNRSSPQRPRRKLYTSRQLSVDSPFYGPGDSGEHRFELGGGGDACNVTVNSWNNGLLGSNHDLRDYVSSISSTESFMSIDESSVTPVSPVSEGSYQDIFSSKKEKVNRCSRSSSEDSMENVRQGGRERQRRVMETKL